MQHVAVIGGGVAGLTAAAALSHHARVTLFETEAQPGTQASGRSAAMFIGSYGNNTVRALNDASEPILRQSGALRPRDLLILGGRGEDADFAATLSAMDAREIAPAEAVRALPILDPAYLSRAAQIDNVAEIDTDAVLQAAAREARARGGEIYTGHGVRGLERRQDGWQITTDAGCFRADCVVNAAGAWAGEIGRMVDAVVPGLVPYRRSVARMPAPGGHDVRPWPAILGAGETWYAKPDAGGWIVSPAEEDPTHPHDAWADDTVIAGGIARYQPYVTEEVTRVDHTWAGLRTFTPDRTPIIGADPRVPGFWWLAGQGGYGFQISPAAARLLVALMFGTGRPLDDACIAALSPARFRAAPGP